MDDQEMFMPHYILDNIHIDHLVINPLVESSEPKHYVPPTKDILECHGFPSWILGW